MRHCLMIPLVLLPLLPAALSAGEPMTGEAFDRYTLGRTLYYGLDGSPYGVERYLPGRRVLWSFLDGRCETGHWYEEAGQICFIYQHRSDPQCWRFSLEPQGLVARFENSPQATELYEVEDLDEEMLCYGPDVGV
ncbi:MAG: hypothetical protein HRU33_11260 [Rhodobacteraceae bacterium]|nr:hypothetical protein [Paracoccaceae bacterium]